MPNDLVLRRQHQRQQAAAELDIIRLLAEAPHMVLTIPQVAERLQMAVTTIRRLCRAHKLPAVRIGGSWRIRADLLEARLAPKWLR